jgi:ectoine hydroxylase-related dioxygenase (phytanoyl-CoA dioxygenase family)
MTIQGTTRAIPVLSPTDIEQFEFEGYVTIKGILSCGEAAAFRDVILDMVPRNLIFPRNWNVNAGRLKPHHEPEGFATMPFFDNQAFHTPELLPLLFNEKLYEVAAQLLGTHRLRAWDASVGITLRNDSGPDLSQKVHVDPGVPDDVPNFELSAEEASVGGCYYLTDVESHGGGIHVVPGGHRLVEEVARQHPDGRQLYKRWRDVDDFPPTVEITGEAGDFIMLHYLMPHAASNNRNPQPRVAQFTRFNREDHRHYPLGLAEPSRYNDLQLQVMTSLGRRLLGVDPW